MYLTYKAYDETTRQSSCGPAEAAFEPFFHSYKHIIYMYANFMDLCVPRNMSVINLHWSKFRVHITDTLSDSVRPPWILS